MIKLLLFCRESHGKQSGPIWQLRWIDRNKGTGEDKGGEVLVSGSADGRITQWSIRKGFEFQGLLLLDIFHKA